MNDVTIMLYSRYTEEIASFVREHLHTQAELSICGALDGLDDQALRTMEATEISQGVPVELNDGSWIYIDHHKIDRRARHRVEELQAEGVKTLMICCTLPWPSLEPLPGVICPSRILEANAKALLPEGGVLGVIQPDANTQAEEIKHWRELGVEVVSATASPEEDAPEYLAEAARSLVDQGADLIVLDCLAFVRDHWQVVRGVTQKPVLLPMALLGQTLDLAYGPF